MPSIVRSSSILKANMGLILIFHILTAKHLVIFVPMPLDKLKNSYSNYLQTYRALAISWKKWSLSQYHHRQFYLLLFLKHLLIWLHWVLVVACRIFGCSMWTFSCSMKELSWSGIKSRPPALGAWSLSHWTTREIPTTVLLEWQHSMPWLSLSKWSKNKKAPGGSFILSITSEVIYCHFHYILFVRSKSLSLVNIKRSKISFLPWKGECQSIFGSILKPSHLLYASIRIPNRHDPCGIYRQAKERGFN